jgi:hypothetical protein
VLLNVVGMICRSKNFRLVDIIYTNCLKDLTIVSWPHLGGDHDESQTWHSTKCPILAFAITGMVTAAMISLIIFGSDILATPPRALISAGTRSSAITATAPASSAMRACRKESQMQRN